MTRKNSLSVSRRELLRSAGAFAAVGLLGTMDAVLRQQALAAGTPERKFLFFFAGGGWDATPLDPKYASDGISPVGGTDMDPDTYLGQAGNLTYSAGPDREAMDTYFRRWGGRTAILRGVNVHSAGHESGTRWMMTGSSASSLADWPTILASRGQFEYPMPHLVFSGPSFPGPFGAAVVRGGGGTLLQLIDGSILGRADQVAPVVSKPMDSMMDAAVHRRAARFAEGRSGLGRSRADAYLGNLERAMELEGRRFEAGLDSEGQSVLEQAVMALEVMRLGLCRCAMIRIPGAWDTHGGNQNVGAQLDSFFAVLDALMNILSTTPGTATSWLSGEVTVVCTSELGRTPRFNGSMGRDHWPYTSMLVAGSGVRGDTVVGETDEGFIARPIDFQTGRYASSGSLVGTENVGTALLELGGVDPERFLPGVQPLRAFLRS